MSGAAGDAARASRGNIRTKRTYSLPMEANRVFAKQVVLEAVQADPSFLERLVTDDAGWLERKWAYACGFTGETSGDALPEIVCRNPIVIRVPGADGPNDVVFLTARGGQLYCLERTMSADGSRLSETEGAYVMRAGSRGAFIDVTGLDLESFLRRVGAADGGPAPAEPSAPARSVRSETSAAGPPGRFSLGNAIMFAMFGGILGGLVGFGLIASDLGGMSLLWGAVVVGVLMGVAASVPFTEWQRSSS
jgi:hypothetical protein